MCVSQMVKGETLFVKHHSLSKCEVKKKTTEQNKKTVCLFMLYSIKHTYECEWDQIQFHLYLYTIISLLFLGVSELLLTWSEECFDAL